MTKISEKIKAIRAAREEKGEEGFSFIELVVSIGLMVALTVGGFIAYGTITDNANQAGVKSAADSIYSAAVAYDAQGTLDDARKAELTGGTGDGVTATITGSGKDLTVVVTKDGKFESTIVNGKNTYKKL